MLEKRGRKNARGWIEKLLVDVGRVLDSPVEATPAIDHESVKAGLCADGRKGESQVRQHHERIFDSTVGKDLQGLGVMVEAVEKFIGECKEALASAQNTLKKTNKHLALRVVGLQWTKFALAKVGVLSGVGFMVLLAAFVALSTILMNSGIEVFENPIRAYTFSLLPIAGSFAWEAFGSNFTTDEGRRRYVMFVQIVAMFLCALWGVLFAAAFGHGFSDVGGAWLTDLTSGEMAASSDYYGNLLIAVGLIGEATIAASCWLTIENIFLKHSNSSPEINPYFQDACHEVELRMEDRRALWVLLAGLKSREAQVKTAREVFIRQAVDEYDIRMTAMGNLAFQLHEKANGGVARFGGSSNGNGSVADNNGNGTSLYGERL